MYEQMPFWVTFFTELGFETIISEETTRDTYYKGQHTIPSDTVCYPAKLAHGACLSLLEKGADFIFFPCQTYNVDEGGSDNHYNCPVVAYYPELLKGNVHELTDDNFYHTFLNLNRPDHVIEAMTDLLAKYGVKKRAVKKALAAGNAAMEQYFKVIDEKSEQIIDEARLKGKKIIVLAGRPYHIDPEINHGIHKLITSLGLAVITEDSIYKKASTPDLNVLNQWTYHSRLYRAAAFVTTQKDMQLVQLVSFGCGIDAITTDEVRDILEKDGKLYTQLKIDEINNLGAAKIRLRSLVAAMD
jgi:predicted nucleotide-binding protein (sugar kinase/HSP70/actin superfamily)